MTVSRDFTFVTNVLVFCAGLSASVAMADNVLWVTESELSNHASVQGGWEESGQPQLPVCLGRDGSGQRRPGKYLKNRCNIPSGGQELSVHTEVILASNGGAYSWEGINDGKPSDWLRLWAAKADGRDTFICRANHRKLGVLDKGVHPGEMFGLECRYGYSGGVEIVKDDEFGDVTTFVNSPFEVLYVPRSASTTEEKKEILNIVSEVDEQWRDRHGFLNINQIDSDDIDNENPVLFTAEYLFLLKKIGVLEGEIRDSYFSWAQTALDKIRLTSGLFDRRPEDKLADRDNVCVRHFSRDEQIGLIIIDWAFDFELGLAAELFAYGEANGWIFENRAWRRDGSRGEKICHHGEWLDTDGLEAKAQGFRTPKFQGLVSSATRQNISKVQAAEISGGYLITMNRPAQSTSGKILGILRREILSQSSNDLVGKAIALFENRLYNQYGSSPLKGMYGVYFSNPGHPFHRLVGYYKH